jgi:hypothetical protein
MTHHRRSLLALILPLAVLLAACGGASPAAGEPVAAVRTMFERLTAGDFDGVANQACAAQREAITEGLAGIGGQMPGVDPKALFSAFRFDTSGLQITEVSRSGSEAEVKVSGNLGFTVDGAKFIEVLGPLASTLPFTPEQLEQQIAAQFPNGIPVDESAKVVQEGGAWKICDPEFSISG